MIRNSIAAMLLAFCSFAFAGGSSPGFVYGQVPTAAQWNSYFATKLDFTPGPVNTIPYWNGNGSQLNALVSGDCTSVANVFTCTKTSGVTFANYLAAPPPIGATTPNTGAFTTINATGTVTTPAPAAGFSGLQVGSGAAATAGIYVGNLASAIAGVWSTDLTPSATNYSVQIGLANTIVNAATETDISVGNAVIAKTLAGGVSVAGTLATTGAITGGTTLTTVGQIHGAYVVFANTTVGASTLSGASMVGGEIMRSGSTAAYTDTTDTATAIVAAIPSAAVGTSFMLRITNTVAFIDTIAAGTGVTLGGTTAIAASTYRDFIGVITATATPAVTLTGTGSGPL